MPDRVAAIDIGTNSVKMSIVERAGEAPRVAVERVVMTRLGRGVDAGGRLGAESIAGTLDVLRELVDEVRAHDCVIAAVGTSALRDASNGDDFLVPAAALLGAPVEVIDGAREAELSHAGALFGLADATDAAVVDVGGGSTELVWGRGGEQQRVSVDIGCVRLSERLALDGVVGPRALRRLQATIDTAIDSAKLPRDCALVANSGTATTLAAMAGEIVPYDAARVHGSWLDARWLRAQLARLAALDARGRAALPGLPAARADVIVAGAAILDRVCARAGAPGLTVSCGGVRLGLAIEMIG